METKAPLQPCCSEARQVYSIGWEPHPRYMCPTHGYTARPPWEK